MQISRLKEPRQAISSLSSHVLRASAGSGAASSSAPSHPSTSGASSAGEFSNSECCECLRTYAEDVRLGTGVEWVECIIMWSLAS